LKGLKPINKTKVQLPGTDRSVAVKKAGGNLVITPPVLTPDDNQLTYVFKVNGLNFQ